MKKILEAGRDYGWLLGVMGFFIAIALFFIGPQAYDHVLEPIGESVGVSSNRCMDGWKYDAPEQDGSVISSPRCIKDGYIAFLDPEDRETCQYVMDTGTETRPGLGELTCEQAGYR